MEELNHSAKGSTWKNHKYTGIKTVNGKKRYIYGTPSSGYRDRGAGIAANRNAAINRRIGGGGPASKKVVNNAQRSGEQVKSLGLGISSNKYESVKKVADKYKAEKAKKTVKDVMSKTKTISVKSVTTSAVKAMNKALNKTKSRNNVLSLKPVSKIAKGLGREADSFSYKITGKESTNNKGVKGVVRRTGDAARSTAFGGGYAAGIAMFEYLNNHDKERK